MCSVTSKHTAVFHLPSFPGVPGLIAIFLVLVIHSSVLAVRSSRRSSVLWLCLVLIGTGFGGGVLGVDSARGQAPPDDWSSSEVSALVETLQTDPRGPFQAIRWFCPDGSVRAPQSRCEQPGGKQHGLVKQEVLQLQLAERIYLDPVLTGTDVEAFWDAGHQQSRLKQYLLQNYLFAADDGWIMRRARYYRGALQAEDEADWSRRFLTWLLRSDERIAQHYYLAREAVRGLPLRAETDLQQRLRALSKEISDAYSPFLDLRVKIHGQPDSTDLVQVQQFRQQHAGAAPTAIGTKLETLEALLREAYAVSPTDRIRTLVPAIGPATALGQRLTTYLTAVEGAEAPTFVSESAALLWTLRMDLSTLPSGEQRLAALQASLALEDAILRSAAEWQPATLAALTEKIHALAQAAAGAGLIEVWEWSHIEERLRPPAGPRASLVQLQQYAQRARRVTDWATGTVFETYQPVVETYEAFEPLARGFLDDRVRGSVLLSLGDATGALAGAYAETAGTRNDVLGLADGRQAQGLNPGVAVGPLEVVPGATTGTDVSPDHIYVFREPPTELEPVAGIASVMEGNLVSHIQLLARNLGIPNAQIPPMLVDDLQRFAGERIFYAVSPGGTVVMKQAPNMTRQERALVERQGGPEDRFRVSTERIDLRVRRPLPLDSLRAVDSGRICGPKAAKVGELKRLFPERVANGLVVPFGVFRAHMSQPMPGTDGSYWDFVQATFADAQQRRTSGDSQTSVETFITDRLARLREAIRKMPLQPEFVAKLRGRFSTVFDQPLGQVPVFVRSDTNMEDLDDFTGAGLNLTLPNVMDEAVLLSGIRDVWASAYSERSYEWRQRLLTNPQDIYPSVLLQRSVDVNASGVLLTTGLTAGGPNDVTVAFNRGVGGAVVGQSAETWLLRADGTAELLAPAREPIYRVLSGQGGVAERTATAETPILSPHRRAALRTTAADIRTRLRDAPGVESDGPLDVELGFVGDRLWLFQVRPFVENKNLRSAEYLRGLDAVSRPNAQVSLTAPLQP